MHPFFFHPDTKDVKDPSDEPMLVRLHGTTYNTSEGGEFLDDAIRMEDLQMIHCEECVAAGSPQNLL